MSSMRELAKACVVTVLGREVAPRRILAGLASGYRIWVSPAENLSYITGMAEPHLQRAIRKYVKAGDMVYDIGANVGYVTLSLAKQVGREGRVVAFEPVAQNLEQLRKNVELNQLKNVIVRGEAASDRAGKDVIRIAGNLSTASMAWHRQDPKAVEITIDTVRIDELTQTGQLPLPSFVKIDVEGAEGRVLDGMRSTLAASHPALFVECSDAGREASWGLLTELGYRCESAVTGEPVEAYERYRHSDFLWSPGPR
jgi:FkbM family methyltransferase